MYPFLRFEDRVVERDGELHAVFKDVTGFRCEFFKNKNPEKFISESELIRQGASLKDPFTVYGMGLKAIDAFKRGKSSHLAHHHDCHHH